MASANCTLIYCTLRCLGRRWWNSKYRSSRIISKHENRCSTSQKRGYRTPALNWITSIRQSTPDWGRTRMLQDSNHGPFTSLSLCSYSWPFRCHSNSSLACHQSKWSSTWTSVDVFFLPSLRTYAMSLNAIFPHCDAHWTADVQVWPNLWYLGMAVRTQ